MGTGLDHVIVGVALTTTRVPVEITVASPAAVTVKPKEPGGVAVVVLKVNVEVPETSTGLGEKEGVTPAGMPLLNETLRVIASAPFPLKVKAIAALLLLPR